MPRATKCLHQLIIDDLLPTRIKCFHQLIIDDLLPTATKYFHQLIIDDLLPTATKCFPQLIIDDLLPTATKCFHQLIIDDLLPTATKCFHQLIISLCSKYKSMYTNRRIIIIKFICPLLSVKMSEFKSSRFFPNCHVLLKRTAFFFSLVYKFNETEVHIFCIRNNEGSSNFYNESSIEC